MRVTKDRSRLRKRNTSDTYSPMEGMANLADVMLVFACGLIVALILSWNVDVSDQGEINQRPDTKYEVEGMENNAEQTLDGEKDLEEMGKVYRDPETGKYYVVEE